MIEEKLKPCPFCRGKAEFDIEPDEEFGDMYFAHCTECGCGTLPQFNTSESAEIWNKRTGDARHAIKDVLSGNELTVKPQELLNMIQAQLRHVLDVNSQIAKQSNLLYQEVKQCQGLIEQLKS